MESLLVLLLIANLAGLFLIWRRQDKQEKHLTKSLEDQADHLSDQLDYRFEQARQASQLDQKDLEVAVSDRLQEVRIELHQGLTQVPSRNDWRKFSSKTRDKTDQRLQALQESNEQRLEQMRQTVEEKLEKTLQTRLQASFETVSKQLESVNRGLGECRRWRVMLVRLIKSFPELKREEF